MTLNACFIKDTKGYSVGKAAVPIHKKKNKKKEKKKKGGFPLLITNYYFKIAV